MNDYIRLKEFGYNFLGPILYTYLKNVRELKHLGNYKVFHLAREGYFLKNCYESFSKDDTSEYLYVSRTFLFRIMISDSYSWDYSLKHGFKGTLLQLFISRFAFTPVEAHQIIPDDKLDLEITLPDDFCKVKEILDKNIHKLVDITSESKNAYLKYLGSLDIFSSELTPLFLDLGYSGTIQKLLTRLLQRDTQGLYFITTASKSFDIDGYQAHIDHVFKSNVSMGDGYTMLDRSMFLESLLTAPQGQFVDIRQGLNDVQMFFGKQSFTQQNPDKLFTLYDGVIQAISDFSNADVSFTVEEVEQIFSAYVTKRNLLPSVSWPLFEFDDAISGFGTVNSLQFFGL